MGKAAVTSALRLNVQYIIYTVGPVWHGGDPDQRFAAERKERTALSEPAGMLLSRSSRFDLAVEYFILHKMVNIVEDNIVLDENNLALLGTR